MKIDEHIGSAKAYLRRGNIALYNASSLSSNMFRHPFADLIVTSPPYNLDIPYNSNNDALPYDQYLDFSRKWMANCFNWANPQGRFVLNVPIDCNKPEHHPIGADLTKVAQQAGWQYRTTIIWQKSAINTSHAWGSWKSASSPCIIAPVELLIVFYKGGWKKDAGSGISDITKDEFMTWVNGVWTIPSEKKSRIGHPAPFPIELPRRVIKLFSFIGDTVFEPFCGSGTTLIAAQQNNRIGIGTELDLGYCELAAKRLSEECFDAKKAA